MVGEAMTLEHIAALTATGESETQEFKETTGTRREATMTVCAFLNQGGGQVLFGVTSDGAMACQQVSERTIEELSAEIRQFDPPAFPIAERVRVNAWAVGGFRVFGRYGGVLGGVIGGEIGSSHD